MTDSTADRDVLIRFLVSCATSFNGAVSRIRLIKFLYLADVHSFRFFSRTATGYRWRFYHYGPWTLEAQQDIDDCAARNVIQPATVPRVDEVGDVTLYSAHVSESMPVEHFSIRLEMILWDEIRRWVRAPLNEFLDYIYFQTPPMRDAKRGEYLHFDRDAFTEEQLDERRSPPRYSSREARKAWQKFLASTTQDATRKLLPRDAIVDDALARALDLLDSEDRLTGPLTGTVEIDPTELA